MLTWTAKKHMQEDRAGNGVLEAIGDERTRTVLAAIVRKPGPVNDLIEQLDLSEATIYRRIETLREHDLVEERTLVADDGNHYNVYWSDFAGAVVTLEEDGYDARVLQEGDLPDAATPITDS